jgi:Zn-dependent membrane protease YugP
MVTISSMSQWLIMGGIDVELLQGYSSVLHCGCQLVLMAVATVLDFITLPVGI